MITSYDSIRPKKKHVCLPFSEQPKIVENKGQLFIIIIIIIIILNFAFLSRLN